MFVARSPTGALTAPANACSICMEDLITEDTTKTGCGHEFHRRCLHQWSRNNQTCPNCRQVLKESELPTGTVPRRYNTRQMTRQPPRTSPVTTQGHDPSQQQELLPQSPHQDANNSFSRTRPTEPTQPGHNNRPQVQPVSTGLASTEALLAALRFQIAEAVRAEVAQSRELFRGEAAHSSPRQQQPHRTASSAAVGQQDWSTRETRSSLGWNQPPAFESTRPNPRVFQPERRGAHYGRRSASPMRRWNLIYDGDNAKLDVDEFIFRAETLTNNTLRGDFNLLAENLHMLLGGRVDGWFWTLLRQNPSPPWEHVKLALRSDWGDHSNDVDIRRRMLNRRQRPNESFSAYCQDLVQLRNRLRAPMTEMEFVENVRMNLLPTIQEQICLHRTTSIAQLRALVMEIQITRARIRSHVPTSYARPRLEEYYAPESEEYLDDHAETRVEEDYLSAVEPPRHASTICWNCDQPGHYYTDCVEEPRGFFCYGCGKKGTVKPRCPHCSQKNFRRVEGNNSSPRPAVQQRKQVERKDSPPFTNTTSHAPPRSPLPHPQ